MRARKALTAALALVTALAVSPSVPPSYPIAECNEQGYPGGYYPYCLTDHVVVKSWLIPSDPPEALYEITGMEGSYGHTYQLEPYWLELQTREAQPMPEAGVVVWRSIPGAPPTVVRLPAAWPGGRWVPDLRVVPWRVWLPLVG